jgi:hypothetical protein
MAQRLRNLRADRTKLISYAGKHAFNNKAGGR